MLAAKVVQKTVADTIRAIGRVEAYSTVDIKAQINGQIMQVNFRLRSTKAHLSLAAEKHSATLAIAA